MNDSISMFIDDELDLDGKITFVKKVHNEDPFYNESITLLEQEKQLRSDVVPLVPDVSFKKASKFYDTRYFNPFFRIAKAGVVAAALILLAFSLFWKSPIVSRYQVSLGENSWDSIKNSFSGSVNL